MRACRLPASLFLPVILVLSSLQGCIQGPVAHTSPDTSLVRPVLQVFTAPRGTLETGNKKALVAPVGFPQGFSSPGYAQVMTETLQDIFLQHRVFLVTAVAGPGYPWRIEDLRARARELGFDFLVVPRVTSVHVPAGESPGWVALDVKVQDVKSGVSLWHVYGEAELKPVPGSYGIFRDTAFRPAPTVTQGFTAVARALADVISGRAGCRTL